jgi:hypothetical protein
MRGMVIALALAGAGCLGRYNAPTDPPPSPPARSQPPPSSSPPQSPPPSPSTTPTPSPTPPPADGGTTTTPPPAPPDGGTSSACAQLDACCQLLPSDQIQGCLDQLTGLDEQTCQGILDQLQSNGYCL